MTQLALALAPVFIAILAGWGARFTNIVPAPAWGGVNRLAYMILAPVFMFTEIVRADLSFEDLSFAWAGVLSFIAMGIVGFGLLLGARGPTFASAHRDA